MDKTDNRIKGPSVCSDSSQFMRIVGLTSSKKGPAQAGPFLSSIRPIVDVIFALSSSRSVFRLRYLSRMSLQLFQ